MRLLSPIEDFVSNTLAAIPTALGRLLYIFELRRTGGKYRHWGMARTYGAERADEAMAEAHSGIFLGLLQTPVAKLDKEMLAEGQGEQAEAAVKAEESRMVPADLKGGSVRHLRAVLLALAWLYRTRGASRATSSPPPPPRQ